MTSNTPQDLVALRQQLGNDNADAVARFVDGRIAAAFSANRTQLEELHARVELLLNQQGATPAVRQAAAAVANATDAHNGAASQAAPSQADATTDTARVQQAAEVVARAENPTPQPPSAPVPLVVNGSGSLEERMSAAESAINGLGARIEGIGTSVANAVAIAIGSRGGSKSNAIRVFLGVFVVSNIVYLGLVMTTSLSWDIVEEAVWTVGLSAALSYIAYLFISSREERMARSAYAESQASANAGGQRGGSHNHGLSIMTPAGYDAHGYADAHGAHGAQAGAHANTGHGQSHAGANAAAH